MVNRLFSVVIARKLKDKDLEINANKNISEGKG